MRDLIGKMLILLDSIDICVPYFFERKYYFLPKNQNHLYISKNFFYRYE